VFSSSGCPDLLSAEWVSFCPRRRRLWGQSSVRSRKSWRITREKVRWIKHVLFKRWKPALSKARGDTWQQACWAVYIVDESFDPQLTPACVTRLTMLEVSPTSQSYSRKHILSAQVSPDAASISVVKDILRWERSPLSSGLSYVEPDKALYQANSKQSVGATILAVGWTLAWKSLEGRGGLSFSCSVLTRLSWMLFLPCSIHRRQLLPSQKC